MAADSTDTPTTGSTEPPASSSSAPDTSVEPCEVCGGFLRDGTCPRCGFQPDR